MILLRNTEQAKWKVENKKDKSKIFVPICSRMFIYG
jgi:hypothetical protein